MKLFDAIRQSPVNMAFRNPVKDSNHLPNVVLLEDKHGNVKPKAFRATGHHAWERRKLAVAKTFDDWMPGRSRGWPFEESEIIERLGGLV